MAFQFLEGWYPKMDDVVLWFEHFVMKGVPAAVVSRPEFPRFTLWRGGEEARAPGQRPSRSMFQSDFNIVMECHGFREEVKGAKGEDRAAAGNKTRRRAAIA